MLPRPLRIAALCALSALLLPLALWSRLLALCGAERAALRLGAALQRRWGRGILAVIGSEVVVEGAPPSGAFVVVSNHLSYLDVPVLAAHFPGRFVAKREIAGWPVFGPLAGAVGTIFLDQDRRRDVVRVQREMARTLAASVSVVLFPEGHSTRGLRVDRLHSSLLECAARGHTPCLAVALGYETPGDPWAPAATVCWWGGMGFWRHAWNLVGLRQVRARVRLAPAARLGTDRKALTEALQMDLAELFVPVRQAPVAPDYPWPELFAAADSGSRLEAP
jgi:1-acyl-sn-glycerol-3-phosphate acyltransferase